MNHVEKESTWVIKIGSAMVTNEGRGIDKTLMASWCAQIAALKTQGIRVVIVSSGAIAEGMRQLGWQKRPTVLSEQQAAAAVGQINLLYAWEKALEDQGLQAAQILLTHDDAASRARYLNIRGTLETLLSHGIVPVINENDTVAFEEIRIGDNDTLGALVANLIEADTYIILTDQQGLYDKDPRKNSDAQLLTSVRANDPNLLAMAGHTGGALGTGGMYTKVKAAQKAATSGTKTYIVHGREAGALLAIAKGASMGTLFEPDETVLAAKKRWILNQAQVMGKITVDAGAQKALQIDKKSLLPIGALNVSGNFKRGDIVAIVNEQGTELGRGLCNYNHDEVARLLKTPSTDIINKLGFVVADELIHRDNWVTNS